MRAVGAVKAEGAGGEPGSLRGARYREGSGRPGRAGLPEGTRCPERAGFHEGAVARWKPGFLRGVRYREGSGLLGEPGSLRRAGARGESWTP